MAKADPVLVAMARERLACASDDDCPLPTQEQMAAIWARLGYLERQVRIDRLGGEE